MTSNTPISCKDKAIQAVASIINNHSSEFHLVPFKTFKAHTKLRSEKYSSFEVLCHQNTYKSTGWLVCCYVKTKVCRISSGVMVFNTTLGGTGKFERHAKGHQKASTLHLNVERPLPVMSKAVIARATSLAVALDLRPLSFTERKKGMEHFVGAFFRASQHIPVGDRIDPASLMPSAKVVTASLKQLVADNRGEYKGLLLDNIYKTGGGLTTDGVTLKVQDTQYQDLTIHYLEVKNSLLGTNDPVINMKVVTLLLKEKDEMGDASSLRAMLGHHLKGITENILIG